MSTRKSNFPLLILFLIAASSVAAGASSTQTASHSLQSNAVLPASAGVRPATPGPSSAPLQRALIGLREARAASLPVEYHIVVYQVSQTSGGRIDENPLVLRGRFGKEQTNRDGGAGQLVQSFCTSRGWSF